MTVGRMARPGLGATALIALAVAGGLYATRGAGVGQAAPAAAPPPAVSVRTLSPHPVRLWSEFSGRLRPVDAAEIRPEVGGRITQVLFHDGQTVKAGDVLFVIDPRPFEAAVARAQANLASAQANVAYAKVQLDRAAGLLPTQAVPRSTYDERLNALRVAEASVKAADAQLQQANLDLEHAHVRAPIAGRTSRAEVTVGNLVGPGAAAPLLTTIVADSPIYADFQVDEQTYLDSVRQGGRAAERRIPVELMLPGASAPAVRGTIDSFDNRIDPASGTIRARAKFDNPDGALVPGMFASVRLGSGAEREALLVPERAIGFDQSRKFVLVVGADGKVGYRAVELGPQVGSARVALKGVAAGDKVIVDGVQHVRPEMVVQPTEAAPDAASAQ